MNSYFNMLIKLLIFLIIVVVVFIIFFLLKMTNFSLDTFVKDEPTQNIKKNSNEPSEDRMKKINDSINQREERIKVLKEVGKELGG